ncbi:MAG: DegT/DnrJ/EryC1/StrS family aminotransferase [Janthinobacterium lividum]
MKIPLIQPNPSRLSQLGAELALIEESGVYSNYGPVNTRFEHALTATLFEGVGGCLTVCNATIGLMVALRHAVDTAGRGLRRDDAARRRYVIMPSFTFAATAHAALWCGLTPLLCDIDPDTWMPSHEAEDALLARYAGQVAAIVPYATFGNCLDMDRYDRIAREHGVPVVVDAAASLGSLDELGRGFGTGSRHSVVFSMHATKTFAVAEGGVIYNADPDALAAMRAMGNEGAVEGNAVSLPGLTAGLGEVAALQALAKLAEFPSVVAHRTELAADYARGLPGWTFQRTVGRLQTHQFMPVLLPDSWTGTRPAFLAALAERGVAAATYFSPHLAEQPYFRDTCVTGGLGTTERIASRVISLPLFDRLTEAEVAVVCAELRALVSQE